VRAVSLFTGAGGLDLGCEAAGFMTIAAVEHSPVARETLRANKKFFPWLRQEAIFEDIVGIDYGAVMESAEVEPGTVTLVHGGPPCTPFSKSGNWLKYKREGADPKASLLDNYVEALRAIQPKAFIMENVYGLAYGNQNRIVLQRFIAGVRSAGYAIDHQVLLASDYGVPQARQRLICVGVREDMLDLPADLWRFEWPQPTYAGPHETRRADNEHLPPHRTAAEAFDGLDEELNPFESEEVVTGTFENELREVPPGDNYLYLTAHRGHPNPKFEWRKRYWTFLLKLAPDRPSSTIQGQPGPWVGPFHWENRRLRVGELKRLMEFPDEFEITGSRRDQQLQLGNAVPTRLGMVVALALKAELLRLGAIDDTASEISNSLRAA